MTTEILKFSNTLENGLSGVFEYDGETGYFYLFDRSKAEGEIIAYIHVLSGAADFSEIDVNLRWNNSRNLVGLFIKHSLWAAFDIQGVKYGGNYIPGAMPSISLEVIQAFS